MYPEVHEIWRNDARMIAPTLWSGIDGIVIDAVGTLIEPSPSVADAYTRAASRQGVELSPVVVRERFGHSFEREELTDQQRALATDEWVEYRRWERIVQDVLPEVPDPIRAFRELWDHFGRADSWRVFDDVASAIDVFQRAGLALRIGSNFDGRLRGVIAGLPVLSPWSEPLLISSEVGFRKPHREFFRAACLSLGCKPSRVLCIGDDLENDVNGACRAGMPSVLLDRSGSRAACQVERFTSLVDIANLFVK
jgi:putative hydrolase of the HAD superfamily